MFKILALILIYQQCILYVQAGNDRIKHGSDAKTKNYSFDVTKAANKTSVPPLNKPLLQRNGGKPKIVPPIANNKNGQVPENKRTIPTGEVSPPLVLTPGIQRFAPGMEAKPPINVTKAVNMSALSPSTHQPPVKVTKPDNKTELSSSSGLVVDGSKVKKYPVAVTKKVNKTDTQLGRTRLKVNSALNITKVKNNTEVSIPVTIVNKTSVPPGTIGKVLLNQTSLLPASKRNLHTQINKTALVVGAPSKRFGNETKLKTNQTVVQAGHEPSKYRNNASSLLNMTAGGNKTEIDHGTQLAIFGNNTKPGNKEPLYNVTKRTNNTRPSVGRRQDAKPTSIISKPINGTQHGHQRIVHGQLAKPKTFPYIVSIGNKKTGNHLCGGSIIHITYILTAAHCCGAPNAAHKFVVKDYRTVQILAGDIDIRKSMMSQRRIYRYPVEIIPHPDYNPKTVANDICLIRFVRPIVDSSYTRSIELGMSTPIPDEECEIAGWGSLNEENTKKSFTLQTAMVKIIDMNWCNGPESYRGVISDATICAGGMKPSDPMAIGNIDACQGDSGGPLVCNNKLNGVVSWGRGCGRPKYPGIYTDVSQFNTWIYTIVNSKRSQSSSIQSKLSCNFLLFVATILNLSNYFRLLNVEFTIIL